MRFALPIRGLLPCHAARSHLGDGWGEASEQGARLEAPAELRERLERAARPQEHLAGEKLPAQRPSEGQILNLELGAAGLEPQPWERRTQRAWLGSEQHGAERVCRRLLGLTATSQSNYGRLSAGGKRAKNKSYEKGQLQGNYFGEQAPKHEPDAGVVSALWIMPGRCLTFVHHRAMPPAAGGGVKQGKNRTTGERAKAVGNLLLVSRK